MNIPGMQVRNERAIIIHGAGSHIDTALKYTTSVIMQVAGKEHTMTCQVHFFEGRQKSNCLLCLRK